MFQFRLLALAPAPEGGTLNNSVAAKTCDYPCVFGMNDAPAPSLSGVPAGCWAETKRCSLYWYPQNGSSGGCKVGTNNNEPERPGRIEQVLTGKG
jgi:hypothetical protein